MISRDHGDIIFECDACSEALETEQADFSSAWNMAKRDGWTTRKIGDVWTHRCPDCNEGV